METFWVLWVPFGPFGTSFGGSGRQNEVPEGARERFYGHHENIDVRLFSCFFRGLGSPMEFQRVVLRSLGSNLGPIGGHLAHFFALACALEFQGRF